MDGGSRKPASGHGGVMPMDFDSSALLGRDDRAAAEADIGDAAQGSA